MVPRGTPIVCHVECTNTLYDDVAIPTSATWYGHIANMASRTDDVATQEEDMWEDRTTNVADRWCNQDQTYGMSYQRHGNLK